jgi:hypothetical protein
LAGAGVGDAGADSPGTAIAWAGGGVEIHSLTVEAVGKPENQMAFGLSRNDAVNSVLRGDTRRLKV